MTGDTQFGLTKLVDYCVKHRLSLLGLGDLLDSQRPDSRTLRFLFEQIDRLREACLQLFFLQGQHEFQTPPWLCLHPWPTYVGAGSLFSVSGFEFYGLDYAPPDVVKEKVVSALPNRPDVWLATHQVWKDFIDRGRAGIAFADLPPIRGVLTGDLHKHKTQTSRSSTGSPLTVVSPGPLCPQKIDEDMYPAFWVMTPSSSAPDGAVFESVPLPARPVIRVDVSTPEELEVALAAAPSYCRLAPDLPAEIARPLIRVRFDRRLPNARASLLAAYRDAHLLIDALPEPEAPAAAPVLLAGTPAQRLAACMDAQGVPVDAPERAVIQRLAESPDPEAELAAMEKGFVESLSAETIR